MRVRVLAFARLRELLGGGTHDVQLESGATVADVWDALAAACTAISPLAASTRIARNGRVVGDRAERVQEGDELSLLPPAGGG